MTSQDLGPVKTRKTKTVDTVAYALRRPASSAGRPNCRGADALLRFVR